MWDNIRNIFKNIYKLEIKNIFYVSAINIIFSTLFELARIKLPNLLNIHFDLFFNVDYLAIYSCILGLVLPLAILLMEKLNNKMDYIVVETYLKNTLMFPFVIYFCSNLVIFTFLNEQYYFIFTSIVSICIMLFMYYKSFKLLSDLRYEKEKIDETRFEIVNNDLQDQIKHFDKSNVIGQYLKFGIKVEQHDYINTYNYKKISIYPNHELRKIEQYNYKIIGKIVKRLKVINKDFIDNYGLNNGIADIDLRPNIVIGLLDIGSTTQIDRSCITMYYNCEFAKEAEDIANLLTDEIYTMSETNNHFYIKANYEYIQNDCIGAINNSSSTILRNSLDKYLDIYKDYVRGIKNNIGDYSYYEAYNQTHSLYEPRAFEILNLIRGDIADYAQVILKQDNAYLMNELISFLYRMMLYSYANKELLSIQYLHGLYKYLNFQSLKLTDSTDTYKRIKLELFEFVGIAKYDIKLDNIDFCKDLLLVCNKTISSILFDLSKEKDKYFFQYLITTFKLINDINNDFEELQRNGNEPDIKLAKIYEDILLNYNCNFFATLSYVIINWEKNNKDISDILSVYDDYNTKELTDVLLNTIEKDNNDKTYSWDILEDRDLDELSRAWNVNTLLYFQHFYCLLLNKRNSDSVNFPLSYPLSTHGDALVKEFEKLGNEKLADKIKKLVLNINNEEKAYIRNTPIDLDKINLFKTNFKNNYNNNARLYKILDITNNVDIVKDKEDGNSILSLNNIVDKTYFLSKAPNDKNIIWTNFEETFADAFIQAEEEKYSEYLEDKSIESELSIFEYLKNNSFDYSKLIIFAEQLAIYNILQYSNISYEIPDDLKGVRLNSSRYFKYDNCYIPVFFINGLKEKCIYLLKTEELGHMKKSRDGFEIEILDFYNNNDLIEKFMNAKVNGLELQGDERKNHLLESVNIKINEYVKFNVEQMKAIKFIK